MLNNIKVIKAQGMKFKACEGGFSNGLKIVSVDCMKSYLVGLIHSGYTLRINGSKMVIK
jgi:hypothetical protein